MLRNLRKLPVNNSFVPVYIKKNTFLTNDYKCTEAWTSQTSSPILTKINLNDFYNILDQNYASKGVISAIDVDIFANAMKDSSYLEELKDLLHKLRLSAETGRTLESTHHATVRNFIEYGHIKQLVDILNDPLNFGLFLDDYTANILLDKLITVKDYELAADVASTVMLQEDFSNDITCALCKYAAYKYITSHSESLATEPATPPQKNKKVEEIKIRVKFLRNPYFDDHFDIKDRRLASGKTLAWISERTNDNLDQNLQIIGWLVYKKYDQLTAICENFIKCTSPKVFIEILDFMKKEVENVEKESKEAVENCISMLSKINTTEVSLEEALQNTIENAINKTQSKDISQQQKLFYSWTEIREQRLEEQTKRLDRAKRMQLMQDKQKELKEQEQQLWFFENEEAIDLEIEEKEKLVEKTPEKKGVAKNSDDNYIPPEILPKRK